MYERTLASALRQSLANFPIATLVGPRQSGKTTLCRATFPDFEYLSMEDPDVRLLVSQDPRAFFKRHPGSLILDEIQRTPTLTSYLQTLVDDPQNGSCKFVLTGSHNLLLMEAVAQSLAGRTRVLELLPLSQAEVRAHEGTSRPLGEVLLAGGYPAIYQRNITPRHWYKDYFRLYVERDVRNITQIKDLNAFELFVRLCAGRAGQLLNFSALATEVGTSQPTAKAWLSALHTTFVCFLLTPHYRNFNKRLLKTPKLYFYDTGLLCYLLGIEHSQQLDTHPLRGAIFENFVVTELLKARHNLGESPRLHFWRDRAGLEVDVVEEQAARLYPIEIKASQTFTPHFLDNLRKFNALQDASAAGTTPATANLGQVICDVDEGFEFQGYLIRSWKEL